MAWRVPTNNQRGRRSGPCRLWEGLDKARHIVPTALLVRVQCFRKGLHKAVDGPITRPIFLSVITGSYCRRRRRFTISNKTRWNALCIWSSLVCKLDYRRRQGERFILTHILGTKYHQISTEVRSLNFPNIFEACDIGNPVTAVLK